MSVEFDIAVQGASAAGYVAAISLARAGRRVALVNSPASRTESPLADWLPADTLEDCPLLRSVKAPAGMDAFHELNFHSWDLKSQSTYKSRGAAGYLLETKALLAALDAAAAKAGVRRFDMEKAPRLELQETAVVMHGRCLQESRRRKPPAYEPCRLQSSLLLIAAGRPVEAMADLAMPIRTAPAERLSLCGLDVPLIEGKARPELSKGLHIMSLERAGRLGFFFVVANTAHVRILSSEDEVRLVPQAARGKGGKQAQRAGGPEERAPLSMGAGAAALAELIARLQQGGLLPAGLNLAKARGAFWRPPGGAALELDTLLAKRTLLVGTAGGFASATTGQTLDPTVRSALVAADVAGKALASERTQDALSAYKTQWRDLLADRIRPPGTSLQMLLGMALSNQAMTRRFAKALLYGESI